jgi:hypothetical protein
VCTEHAVAVIIAKDRNSLLLYHSSKHTIDSLIHGLNRKWTGKVTPRGSLDEGIDVLDSAPGENFNQWLAQKHFLPPDEAF